MMDEAGCVEKISTSLIFPFSRALDFALCIGLQKGAGEKKKQSPQNLQQYRSTRERERDSDLPTRKAIYSPSRERDFRLE